MTEIDLATHRVLVAIFIESHRGRPRWLGREGLQSEYHVSVSARQFDGIAQHLSQQGLASSVRDETGLKLRLKTAGHVAALQAILRALDANSFEVNWKGPRIVTDSRANLDNLVPCPGGWMLLTTDRPHPTATSSHEEDVPAPSGMQRSDDSPWVKWQTILTAAGLLATIIIGLLAI